MDRSTTNAIRFVMDECLPPVLRDNKYFMYPFFHLAYRGKNIRTAMEFKSLVHDWSEEEYDAYYSGIDSISRNRLTDLNRPSLELVLRSIDPAASSLIDVGCGRGYLLREISRSRPELALTGLDVKTGMESPEYAFVQGHVQEMPFPDKSFDVVVSSHTLEHLLDLDRAVAELKRIARKQVIVVTPCQRYFYYTLDEHVNFFPYAGALTSVMNMDTSTCRRVQGDWVYIGTLS